MMACTSNPEVQCERLDVREPECNVTEGEEPAIGGSCGSDIAYPYFISFYVLCSFLVSPYFIVFKAFNFEQQDYL